MRKRVLALVTLGLVTVMVVVGSGAGSAQQALDAVTETTEGEVVGASITHPPKWLVERERHTYDGTYGFTLWRPQPDPEAHDHGGSPAIRVARAYDLRPEQVEERVQERLAAYPDLPLERRQVSVGEQGHEGVAVGPIPGSTPSTEVYVPVGGRVYQINVYQPGLDADARELLSNVSFDPPSRPVESLGLPDAAAAGAYYAAGDPELAELERSAREDALTGTRAGTATRSGSGMPRYREKEIGERCWRAKSPFFFQTQHGRYANKNRWEGRRPGWTRIGVPNYWGQYSHGNMGLGRCDERIYTNDKYAVDYPLMKGDVIFSPFKRGTVTFAGQNNTHRDYGIFVTIKHDNNKYVSMSAHLSALAKGIEQGARVTDKTIIGYAGNTGGPTVPVGDPHLHQAFYRNPSYNPDRSPYGGAGLKVVYHHYVGTAARDNGGVYQFGEKTTRRTKSKGDWVSN